MRKILLIAIAILAMFTSCKKSSNNDPDKNDLPKGVYIVNQGSFNNANASLSYFETANGILHKSLFEQVNKVTLGDVAQSIYIHGSEAWIVVNNSGLIYSIDKATAEYKGKISGLTSPRHMLFINDQKAYVSDLYSQSIAIVNPLTYEVTGEISVKRTTEEMVFTGNKAYVANWSAYGQELMNDVVLVIDTQTDALTDTIEVGIEPNSLLLDKNDNIWVLCSGGYLNDELPSLWKIDPQTDEVVSKFDFPVLESNPIGLKINGTGDQLYFINSGIYKMSIDDEQLPETPFISQDGDMAFSCLGIDPENGDIYAGNPLDYQSDGIVYHFSASGTLLDELNAGIAPGAFGFND